MKELNLPDTYTGFSWEDGEGKEKAYTALTSNGLCSDFSFEIWNEIADSVKSIRDYFSLDWDNTYLSYTATRLDGGLIDFTAKRFNSVRRNIEGLAPTTWQWAFNTDFNGYIGRTDFVGVSETSKEEYADIVYGSYFLELVRKLNLTIDVLQDGDSAIGISPESVEWKCIPAAELFPATSASAASDISAQFKDDISLTVAAGETLGVSSVFLSGFDVTLDLKQLSDGIFASTNGVSAASAALELELLCSPLNAKNTLRIEASQAELSIDVDFTELNSEANSEFTPSIILSPRQSYPLDITHTDKLSAAGEMENVPTLRIGIDYVSYSISGSRLERANPIYLRYNSAETMSCSAVIEKYSGTDMSSSVYNAARMYSSDMTNAASAVMSSGSSMQGYISSAVTVNPSLNAQSDVSSIAAISSDALSSSALPMAVETNSKAECDGGTLLSVETIPISSDVSLSAVIDTSMNAQTVRFLVSDSEMTSAAPSEVTSCGAGELTANTELKTIARFAALEGYSESEELYALTELELNTDLTLSMLDNDISISASSVFAAMYTTEIDLYEPIGIEAEYIAIDSAETDFTLYAPPNDWRVATEAFKTDIVGALSPVKFIALSTETAHAASTGADISFDPKSWRNPEQSDNSIMIYQIYGTTQTEDTILIDSEET